MKKQDKHSRFEEYSDKDIREWLTIFDLSDDPVELSKAMFVPMSEEKEQIIETKEFFDEDKKMFMSSEKDIAWHDHRVRGLMHYAYANGYNVFYDRLHDLIIDDVKHFPIKASQLMSERDGVFYSV